MPPQQSFWDYLHKTKPKLPWEAVQTPPPSPEPPQTPPDIPFEGSAVPTDVAEQYADIDPGILRALWNAARTHNVPFTLLLNQARVESGFNPRAQSGPGAQGLLQLMPGTAQDMGVSDPFDVSQNTMGGAKYMRWLLDRYGNDVEKALAAYNAGISRVDASGGIPKIRETQDYVNKVLWPGKKPPRSKTQPK